MSVHVAAVAAQASPSLSPTPLPSVSPSPVVHAAVHAATATASSWGNLLSALAGSLSQGDIIAIAAALAVILQGFVNKHSWMKSDLKRLQDAKRFIVALALPYLGTLLASFASGQNTQHLWLPVFVLGQVIFYAFQLAKNLIQNTSTSGQAADLAGGQGVG